MSGPEVVPEVAIMAATTWDSKVAAILELLNDNGYVGLYTWAHLNNILSISFVAPSPKVFTIDLTSDATHRKILDVIDDYFGEFEHDRSYVRDDTQDIKL